MFVIRKKKIVYHITINIFDFDKFYEINISCFEEETRWKKCKKKCNFF